MRLERSSGGITDPEISANSSFPFSICRSIRFGRLSTSGGVDGTSLVSDEGGSAILHEQFGVLRVDVNEWETRDEHRMVPEQR